MHGLSEPDRDRSRASVLRITPPFVGRRQELAWIEQSIQAAIDGRPRVVLLAGDAGIGKTRLLKAVQSVASRRGVRVCYGRCYEDLPLPYLPFIEAFLAHLDPVPEDVARVLGVEAQAIGQFLHRSREAMPTANS